MKFWLWWLYLFRSKQPKTRLLSPADEVTKSEPTPPLVVSSEVTPDRQIEPAVDTSSGLLLEESDQAGQLQLESGPGAVLSPPPPDEEAPLSLPAAIPRPLLQAPKYPDEWLRSRAMYFAAATYSPTTAAERVLAPDLLFRLGIDKRRALVEPPPPTAPTPPVETPPIREREPRLMEAFATSGEMDPPQPDRAGRVLSVDPLLLTLFFATREAGPDVPAEATTEYLTEPALLAHGIELRDRILRHWSAGGPPLSVRQFYDVAVEIVRHTGTALLLCHNTAKAFARGGEAICWRLVNRTRGEYQDGKLTSIAAVLHRNGILKSGAFANPSIFYVLFSAGEFGSGDAGAWYRYFVAAAAAYYAASGQARVPMLPLSPAAEHTARLLVDISRQMIDPKLELTPAYRGWLWANAWMFFENAAYGRANAGGRPDALPSLRGACFGIQQAGREVYSGWRWHVALPGAQISTPFNLAATSAHELTPEDAVPAAV